MTKKIIIPAVMLFIAAILIYSMGGSAVAYAEGNEVLFDSTYVLDDLEGLGGERRYLPCGGLSVRSGR